MLDFQNSGQQRKVKYDRSTEPPKGVLRIRRLSLRLERESNTGDEMRPMCISTTYKGDRWPTTANNFLFRAEESALLPLRKAGVGVQIFCQLTAVLPTRQGCILGSLHRYHVLSAVRCCWGHNSLGRDGLRPTQRYVDLVDVSR